MLSFTAMVTALEATTQAITSEVPSSTATVVTTAEQVVESSKQVIAAAGLIDTAQKAVAIATGITTLVVTILGFRIARQMNRKRYDAYFDFYSRFIVYLSQLRLALGKEERSVFYSFYPKSLHTQYNSNMLSLSEADSLNEIIEDILKFLRATEGQIPPDIEWHEQEILLLNFLVSASIKRPEKSYSSNDKKGDMAKIEFRRLDSLINKLILKMRNEQKDLLEKMNRCLIGKERTHDTTQ